MNMTNKFPIFFAVFGFLAIGACAQTRDKKTDSVKPAKEVILQNSGERELPQQLKENQLKGQPVILKADSSINTSKTVNRTKSNCSKLKKKKGSSSK